MEGRPLKREQYESVWDFYRTNCTALHCARIIKNSVLAAGISDGVDTKPTPRSLYVHRHLEGFARDAFDWIICIGLVPVVLRMHPAINELLPEIPSSQSVHITVSSSVSGQSMFGCTVQSRDCMLPMLTQRARVMVWSGGDNLPGADGDIYTPLSALEDSQRLLQFWVHHTKVATRLGSNPVLVTQNRTNVNRDTDGVVWNVDEETACAAERARVERVEAVANHQREHRKQNVHHWGIHGDESALESACVPTEYYLPEERDLARTGSSLVPANMIDMMRWADERIYAAFGVPPGMFSTTGQKVSNRYEVEGIFRGQVRRMRRLIENCMNDSMTACASYDDIHRNPAAWGIDPPGRAKRKSAESQSDVLPATISMAPESEGGTDPTDTQPQEGQTGPRRVKTCPGRAPGTLTLASVSCASPDEAMRWWEFGFISFDEADACIRAYAGLPEATENTKARMARAQAAIDTEKRCSTTSLE